VSAEPESEPVPDSSLPLPLPLPTSADPAQTPASGPAPPSEDDELLPEEGRSLFVRLVPPGSGRRLGLARALVVGPGLALGAGVAPLIVLSTGERGIAEQLAALVLCALPLLVLGAGGGLASGLAERRLAHRPVLRWGALIAAPGVLTWLLSLQLVYVVGVSRAGVQGGYERLGAFVDPGSRDAVYALTFAVGSGLGLGLALAQVVHRRLRGDGLRSQLLGALGVLVRGLLVVGCGGCALLGCFAVVMAAFGIKDEFQGMAGQGAIALWMSSFASLLSLGLLAALLGPWLLQVADRLEARWGPTTAAPRP
jgi:hypothetical protein